MKALNAAWKAKKNALDQPTPWVWLYEVVLPSSPETTLYLAEYDEPVTYAGNTYEPFPIKHTEPTEDSAGKLASITVSVANASREIQAYLEAFDYLTGQAVTIHLVENPTAPTAALSSTLLITSTTANEQVATFQLSLAFNAFGITVGRRMYRDACGWRFGSAECGYSGPISDCDKTLGGPNGCRTHSNAARFGGAPGIPQSQVIIS